MGFITGFTGGATLTLGLASLFIFTHQRNRKGQADILRRQTKQLNALVYAPSTAPRSAIVLGAAPPSRQEPQHSLVERAKERWNDDIYRAVRWLQGRDWTASRVEAERALGLHSDGRTTARVAEVMTAVEDEAKNMVAKGVVMGHDAADKAKAAFGMAENRVGDSVPGQDSDVLGGESEVQRALRQRYEGTNVMDKSVRELLAERYERMDERNDTRLRGL